MNNEDASKLVAMASLLADARANEARAKNNLDRAIAAYEDAKREAGLCATELGSFINKTTGVGNVV